MAAEYRAWRHRTQNVTDATINRAISVLKHILYWGVDEQLLPANPWARLRTHPGATTQAALS